MFTDRRGQFGLSLVELAIFIAVVGAGVAGILLVLSQTTRSSADPLLAKQALAIAESMLEEVQLMPFTYCDPDDTNAATAASAADCASLPEALGPEAGESRYGAPGGQFDNVNDYRGYSSAAEAPPGIKDITGNPIAALASYAVSVEIVAAALGAVPAGDALLITVTATGPGNTVVALQGYRTRHAPNALP